MFPLNLWIFVIWVLNVIETNISMPNENFSFSGVVWLGKADMDTFFPKTINVLSQKPKAKKK